MSLSELHDLKEQKHAIINHGYERTPLSDGVDAGEEDIIEGMVWLYQRGFKNGHDFHGYTGGGYNSELIDRVDKYAHTSFGTSGDSTPAVHPVPFTSPFGNRRVNFDDGTTAAKDAITKAADENSVAHVYCHNNRVTTAERQEIADHIEASDVVPITYPQLYTLNGALANQEIALEHRDTATFSSDGAATTFTVTHGLPIAIEPASVVPDLGTDAVAVDGYQNVQTGSFDIVFSAAPASGTNNVTISYAVER